MDSKYYDYVSTNIHILDMNLLKSICQKLDIEYNIYLENKKTAEILHKEFIIELILHKLKTGKVIVIRYPKKIQNYNDTKNLDKDDFVYYGQYKTVDKNVYRLLRKLTNNKFYFGAISQKIVKTHWKNSNLITYKQLAEEWLKEYEKEDVDYKESAYNQFKKNGGTLDQWKKFKNYVINNFKKIKLL
jgi:hypothetical protein